MGLNEKSFKITLIFQKKLFPTGNMVYLGPSKAVPSWGGRSVSEPTRPKTHKIMQTVPSMVGAGGPAPENQLSDNSLESGPRTINSLESGARPSPGPVLGPVRAGLGPGIARLSGLSGSRSGSRFESRPD